LVRVLGVDASRAGWIGIELDDGHFAGARLAARLGDLLTGDPAAGEQSPPYSVVGVDTPIGLLPAGWRDCDRSAAARIGRRRSSVFAVPPAAVWDVADYAEANALCRTLTGGGFSKQAYNLRPRVLEANALPGLFEVHPEVSFRELAGVELPHPKLTWAGHTLRRALLRAGGIDVPDDLGTAGGAGPDDILDAAAVAWTAHRIATGHAKTFPSPPTQHTTTGAPIVIWA
jgi:predicted RNase H-like nuclease